MSERVYQERIVFFLDILGFRSLIERGEAGSILDALSDLDTRRKTYETSREMQFFFPLKLSIFSDSIIASVTYTTDNKSLVVGNACRTAAQLAHSLLLKGILTRGAGHIGDFYHEGNIGFGPALVKAYEVEQKLAFYPRIVIPDEVRDWAVGSLNPLEGVLPDTEEDYFFRDADGITCLHTLSPHWDSLILPSAPTWKDAALTPLRRLIAEQREYAKGDPRALAKIDWMVSYIDRTEREFGGYVLKSS